MAPCILWQRLDTPGHDACALTNTGDGWELGGAAVFLDTETHEPAALTYRIRCDPAFRNQSASVQGFVGARRVAFEVARDRTGTWMLDGRRVPGLEGCEDLDLGFTPATNLLSIRRLALDVGQGAEVPVAWFDLTETTLRLLPQHYRRRSRTTYAYDSPTVGYSAELEVDEDGFVRSYPGLWRAE